VKGGSKAQSARRRVPAGNLENIVVERLQRLFSSQAELLDAIENAGIGGRVQRQLLQRGRQIAEELGTTPEQNRSIITALVRRVEIGSDIVKIDVSQDRLAALLGSDELKPLHDEPIDPSEHILTLTAPFRLTRVGREMKLLVEVSDDNRSPDMGLLRVVARAHDVQRRLAEDTSLTVHDIAREERVTADYLYILLRLRWLAPDITSEIINGRQPPQFNAKRLMRLTAQLPANWSEQRALLGFR
jgi:hypothetical protein